MLNIEFCTKRSVGLYVYLSQSEAKGLQKFSVNLFNQRRTSVVKKQCESLFSRCSTIHLHFVLTHPFTVTTVTDIWREGYSVVPNTHLQTQFIREMLSPFFETEPGFVGTSLHKSASALWWAYCTRKSSKSVDCVDNLSYGTICSSYSCCDLLNCYRITFFDERCHFNLEFIGVRHLWSATVQAVFHICCTCSKMATPLTNVLNRHCRIPMQKFLVMRISKIFSYRYLSILCFFI